MSGPLTARVGELTGRRITGERPVGGGSICDARRLTVADGSAVFAKTLDPAPPGFFAAEADGLALLGDTSAVAVPQVLAVEPDLLVLEWIEPGRADAAQAEALGRDLAALHSRPAASWGTPGRRSYLGPLPLTSPDEPLTAAADWPAFHAAHRLLPFLRQAVDRGAIGPADARDVELLCDELPRLAGPPQPPTVIHGDLWSGNVHWAADGRARLVPCARGARGGPSPGRTGWPPRDGPGAARTVRLPATGPDPGRLRRDPPGRGACRPCSAAPAPAPPGARRALRVRLRCPERRRGTRGAAGVTGERRRAR